MDHCTSQWTCCAATLVISLKVHFAFSLMASSWKHFGKSWCKPDDWSPLGTQCDFLACWGITPFWICYIIQQQMRTWTYIFLKKRYECELAMSSLGRGRHVCETSAYDCWACGLWLVMPDYKLQVPDDLPLPDQKSSFLLAVLQTLAQVPAPTQNCQDHGLQRAHPRSGYLSP